VIASILKRSAAGRTDFSSAELVLYTAGEFWAATASRRLVAHLGTDANRRLRAAYVAFSTIGAERIAAEVKAAVGEYPAQAPTSHSLRERAAGLEARLVDIGEPVDHLITQYALQILNGVASDKPSQSTPPAACRNE
jgi:hypothetical protein